MGRGRAKRGNMSRVFEGIDKEFSEGLHPMSRGQPGTVARIAEVIGEWHDHPAEDLEGLFAGTHDVEILESIGGIGIFRALRRV